MQGCSSAPSFGTPSIIRSVFCTECCNCKVVRRSSSLGEGDRGRRQAACAAAEVWKSVVMDTLPWSTGKWLAFSEFIATLLVPRFCALLQLALQLFQVPLATFCRRRHCASVNARRENRWTLTVHGALSENIRKSRGGQQHIMEATLEVPEGVDEKEECFLGMWCLSGAQVAKLRSGSEAGWELSCTNSLSLCLSKFHEWPAAIVWFTEVPKIYSVPEGQRQDSEETDHGRTLVDSGAVTSPVFQLDSHPCTHKG